MARPATIKDVAEHAGVSKTTVSHVLNNTRFVADSTKNKVLHAVQMLHYEPSAVARSLKVKSTRTLGMIVTSTSNPFYAEIVREVEKCSYKRGYNLILCNTEGDPAKTRSYMQMLAQKRADGILVMCSTFNDALFATIAEQNSLPVVVMDWGPSLRYIDKIQDNSFKGGQLATEHLIELGHTRIAHIGGPAGKFQADQRLQGFKEAMQSAGIAIRPNWIIESDFECEGGFSAMKALLSQTSPPTGIFAANDMMAMGAFSAAQQMGFFIPRDISVIGYDNISFSAYFTPPLTTIKQPLPELAYLAVDTLIERLDFPRDNGKILMLEPTLVKRLSTTMAKS